MSRVQDGNYIVIQSFMVTDLHLKGNELLIYAIIYGFSQDGEHYFNGGNQYLADWLNTSKQTVISNLKALVEKGLIAKKEETINGVKFLYYQSKNLTGGSQKTLLGGSQISLPNNKTLNNIYIFIEEWNKLSDVPKITSIRGTRATALKSRIDEYGEDKIIEAIKRIDKSSFLKGKNERGWTINFDWFIKPSNFVKVLEGNYDDKPNGKLKRKPSFDIDEIAKKAKLNEDYDID